MKKETLLAIAAALTAIAHNEFGGSTEVTNTTPTPDPDAEKPKRRGRPPGTSAPPQSAEGTTTESAPNTAETKTPEKPKLTEEEAEANYQKLRGVIEPYVKGNWTEPAQPKGPEVKKIIAKYAPETGSLKELANFPEKHADFQRDIEALGY